MKLFRAILCFLLVLVVFGSGQHVVGAATECNFFKKALFPRI